jgi:hypothetical protein
MENTSMLDQLKQYYSRNGISAVNFHCPNYTSCSQHNPLNFTTAKESFVSSGYIVHELPRLLFISLDSGSGELNPVKKTLESVRHVEEFITNVYTLPKIKHWYRTHELAYTILRNFKPGMELDEARHYFAHMNSAKCCENNPERGQANPALFGNCRCFIPGEVGILDPDIIITQGQWAHTSIEGSFLTKTKPAYFPSALNEISLININSHPVIWIKTYHPRNPNSKQNRNHYPQYEQVVIDFWNARSGLPTRVRKPEPANDADEKIIRSYERKKNVSPNQPVLVKKREAILEGDYIKLSAAPALPLNETPSRVECEGYEYMTMKQLCNIAEQHGMGRSRAGNAFGGDKGKYKVISDRKARVYMGRKYVLVRAVIDYFKDEGINW